MVVSGANLARWYREISQQLRGGVALPRAIELAGGVPQRARQRLAEHLRAGESVGSVLGQGATWLPEVDRQVLTAASESGKIAETLAALAVQRDFMAKQAKRAMGAMVYPLFVVHFAMLVLPVYVLLTVSTEAYLRMVLPLVLPLWVFIAVLVWSVRRRQAWVRRLMLLIPLLRGHRKHKAVADLSFALSGYVTAGQTIDVAWAGAANACGDSQLKELGHRIAERARLGDQPGSLLATSRVLPEDFVSLYQTGEATGQLEENLNHLWQLYSERASDKLSSAGVWYPKILMIGVAIGIGYVVVKSYSAYLDSVLEMM